MQLGKYFGTISPICRANRTHCTWKVDLPMIGPLANLGLALRVAQDCAGGVGRMVIKGGVTAFGECQNGAVVMQQATLLRSAVPGAGLERVIYRTPVMTRPRSIPVA